MHNNLIAYIPMRRVLLLGLLMPLAVNRTASAWQGVELAWPPGADVLDPRLERARKHWAFQPLHAVEPPFVGDAEWISAPIDQFILAALEAKGLEPIPPAPPGQMIRRIKFDLVGLPPDPAEIEEFSAAVERDRKAAECDLVDRLLQSCHYGERWARHW